MPWCFVSDFAVNSELPMNSIFLVEKDKKDIFVECMSVCHNLFHHHDLAIPFCTREELLCLSTGDNMVIISLTEDLTRVVRGRVEEISMEESLRIFFPDFGRVETLHVDQLVNRTKLCPLGLARRSPLATKHTTCTALTMRRDWLPTPSGLGFGPNPFWFEDPERGEPIQKPVFAVYRDGDIVELFDYPDKDSMQLEDILPSDGVQRGKLSLTTGFVVSGVVLPSSWTTFAQISSPIRSSQMIAFRTRSNQYQLVEMRMLATSHEGDLIPVAQPTTDTVYLLKIDASPQIYYRCRFVTPTESGDDMRELLLIDQCQTVILSDIATFMNIGVLFGLPLKESWANQIAEIEPLVQTVTLFFLQPSMKLLDEDGECVLLTSERTSDSENDQMKLSNTMVYPRSRLVDLEAALNFCKSVSRLKCHRGFLCIDIPPHNSPFVGTVVEWEEDGTGPTGFILRSNIEASNELKLPYSISSHVIHPFDQAGNIIFNTSRGVLPGTVVMVCYLNRVERAVVLSVTKTMKDDDFLVDLLLLDWMRRITKHQNELCLPHLLDAVLSSPRAAFFVPSTELREKWSSLIPPTVEWSVTFDRSLAMDWPFYLHAVDIAAPTASYCTELPPVDDTRFEHHTHQGFISGFDGRRYYLIPSDDLENLSQYLTRRAPEAAKSDTLFHSAAKEKKDDLLSVHPPLAIGNYYSMYMKNSKTSSENVWWRVKLEAFLSVTDVQVLCVDLGMRIIMPFHRLRFLTPHQGERPPLAIGLETVGDIMNFRIGEMVSVQLGSKTENGAWQCLERLAVIDSPEADASEKFHSYFPLASFFNASMKPSKLDYFEGVMVMPSKNDKPNVYLLSPVSRVFLLRDITNIMRAAVQSPCQPISPRDANITEQYVVEINGSHLCRVTVKEHFGSGVKLMFADLDDFMSCTERDGEWTSTINPKVVIRLFLLSASASEEIDHLLSSVSAEKCVLKINVSLFDDLQVGHIVRCLTKKEDSTSSLPPSLTRTAYPLYEANTLMAVFNVNEISASGLKEISKLPCVDPEVVEDISGGVQLQHSVTHSVGQPSFKKLRLDTFTPQALCLESHRELQLLETNSELPEGGKSTGEDAPSDGDVSQNVAAGGSTSSTAQETNTHVSMPSSSAFNQPDSDNNLQNFQQESSPPPCVEQPSTSKTLNGWVSHVVSPLLPSQDCPCRFYLQSVDIVPLLEQLKEILNDTTRELHPPTSLDYTSLFVAPFEGANYRCRVRRFGINVVEVLFVDYGNTALVAQNDMRLPPTTPTEICTVTEDLATLCELVSVESACGSVNSIEVDDLLTLEVVRTDTNCTMVHLLNLHREVEQQPESDYSQETMLPIQQNNTTPSSEIPENALQSSIQEETTSPTTPENAPQPSIQEKITIPSSTTSGKAPQPLLLEETTSRATPGNVPQPLFPVETTSLASPGNAPQPLFPVEAPGKAPQPLIQEETISPATPGNVPQPLFPVETTSLASPGNAPQPLFPVEAPGKAPQPLIQEQTATPSTSYNALKPPKRPPLAEGTVVEGIVVECANNTIFVQPSNEYKLLEDLSCALNDKEGQSSERLPDVLKSGSYCQALYFKEWYRVKVLEDCVDTAPDVQVKVYFIDYGNTSLVRRQDMRVLTAEQLTKYHLMVLECRFADPNDVPVTEEELTKTRIRLDHLVEAVDVVKGDVPWWQVSRVRTTPVTITTTSPVAVQPGPSSQTISSPMKSSPSGSPRSVVSKGSCLPPRTTERAGEVLEVNKTHTNSYGLTWVARDEDEKLQDFLKDVLDREFTRTPLSESQFKSLRSHDLVLANFQDFSYPFRAEIRGLERNLTLVHFIDYGNYAHVRRENLFPIPMSLLQLPRLCFICQSQSENVRNSTIPTVRIKLLKRKDAYTWFVEEAPTLMSPTLPSSSSSQVHNSVPPSPGKISVVPTTKSDDVRQEETTPPPVVAASVVLPSRQENSGDIVKGCVVFVEPASRLVVVNLDADGDALTGLDEKLKASELSNEKVPASAVRKGLLCVAQFQTGYYRARVLVVNSESDILVEFVDFGNTTCVQQVHPLPSWANQFPPLSLKCHLEEGNNLDTIYVDVELALELISWEENADVWRARIHRQEAVDATVKTCKDQELHVNGQGNGTLELLQVPPHETPSVEEATSSARKPLPVREDSVGTVVSGYVVYTDEEEHRICVQTKADSEELENVQALLHNMDHGQAVPLQELSVGFVGVAVFAEVYYRAQVIGVSEGASVRVEFVDFGNRECVEQVFKLPGKLCRVPPLCVQCTLTGEESFSSDEMVSLKLMERSGDNVWRCQLAENSVSVSSQPAKEVCDVTPQVEETSQVLQLAARDDCVDALVTGYVIYVDKEEKRICVQTDQDAERLDNIQVLLNGTDIGQPVPLQELSVGFVGVSQFEGVYYRARVIGSHDSTRQRVEFVDFGNRECVEQMFRLPSQLLEVPPLCLQCRVDGGQNVFEVDGLVSLELLSRSDDGVWFCVLASSANLLKATTQIVPVPAEEVGNSGHPSIQSVPHEQSATVSLVSTSKTEDARQEDNLSVVANVQNQELQVNGDAGKATNDSILPGSQELSQVPPPETPIVEETIPSVRQSAPLENLPVREDTVGTVVSGYVVYTDEEEHRICVQTNADSEELENVQGLLNNMDHGQAVLLQELSVGFVGVAVFAEVYYRAQVIGVPDESSVRVEFVDFGNRECVEQVFRLPQKLLKVPPLCLQCRVDGGDGRYDTDTLVSLKLSSRSADGIWCCVVEETQDSSPFIQSIPERHDVPKTSTTDPASKPAEIVSPPQEATQDSSPTCIQSMPERHDDVPETSTTDHDAKNASKPAEIVSASSHSIRTVPERQDSPGTIICGYVTHCNTQAGFIFLQLETETAFVDTIQTCLNAAGVVYQPVSTSEAVVGLLGAALYEGVYYRAKIIAVLQPPESGFQVEFIDYGNVGCSEQVFHIHESLCVFPPLCVKCHVENVSSFLEREEAISARLKERVAATNEWSCEVLTCPDLASPQDDVVVIVSPSVERANIPPLVEIPNVCERNDTSGTTLNGVVVHVNLHNPQLISVRQHGDEETVNRIQAHLNSDAFSPQLVQPNMALPGLFGVAKYEDKYCRAKMITRRSSNQIRVEFVDFGNYENLEEIFWLPTEFRSIPPLCVKCRLNRLDDETEETVCKSGERISVKLLGRSLGDVWTSALQVEEMRDTVNGVSLASSQGHQYSLSEMMKINENIPNWNSFSLWWEELPNFVAPGEAEVPVACIQKTDAAGAVFRRCLTKEEESKFALDQKKLQDEYELVESMVKVPLKCTRDLIRGEVWVIQLEQQFHRAVILESSATVRLLLLDSNVGILEVPLDKFCFPLLPLLNSHKTRPPVCFLGRFEQTGGASLSTHLVLPRDVFQQPSCGIMQWSIPSGLLQTNDENNAEPQTKCSPVEKSSHVLVSVSSENVPISNVSPLCLSLCLDDLQQAGFLVPMKCVPAHRKKSTLCALRVRSMSEEVYWLRCVVGDPGGEDRVNVRLVDGDFQIKGISQDQVFCLLEPSEGGDEIEPDIEEEMNTVHETPSLSVHCVLASGDGPDPRVVVNL